MEIAEAAEHEQMEALGERFIHKSWLFHLADGNLEVTSGRLARVY